MKLGGIYWGLIAIVATFYLNKIFTLTSWQIPFYLVGIIAIIVSYILYKRSTISFSNTDKDIHCILLFIQVLSFILSLLIHSTALNILLFCIFISIEWTRIRMSKKLSSEREHIQQLEKQQKQLNETFRVVRSERHDFLKHVTAIHYMLEHGQNQEAKTYFDSLLDSYKQTNLSIRGERGTVAGILHEMYKQADMKGIHILYDLDVPLSTLPLGDLDVVSLVGNLLSNAIEASEEWQSSHKQQASLSLQFYKRSGLYILICKNTSLPIPIHIIDHLYETYGHTTKSGGHRGFGTKIIDTIVTDNNGFLDFIHKGEEFTIKIKFPAVH